MLCSCLTSDALGQGNKKLLLYNVTWNEVEKWSTSCAWVKFMRALSWSGGRLMEAGTWVNQCWSKPNQLIKWRHLAESVSINTDEYWRKSVRLEGWGVLGRGEWWMKQCREQKMLKGEVSLFLLQVIQKDLLLKENCTRSYTEKLELYYFSVIYLLCISLTIFIYSIRWHLLYQIDFFCTFCFCTFYAIYS